jgi:hypothetical protein
MEKGASQCIRVKCGSKEAEFYPQKCRKSGKTIANCIKYNGRWLNPLEFESLAGLHGRKWRENIKYEGKPIGKWLNEQDYDPSSQRGQIDPDIPPPSTASQGANTDMVSPVGGGVDGSPTLHTRVVVSDTTITQE